MKATDLRILLSALVSLPLLALADCAYEIRDNPPASYISAPASKPALSAKGGAVVVLSYPGYVEPDARAQVINGFEKRALDTRAVSKGAVWDQAFDLMMLRTTFHVRDFYSVLTRELPNVQILLEPGTVYLKPDGSLGYKVSSPELPAVVRVDFLTYVYPNPQPTGVEEGTYARFFLPLFAIKGSGNLFKAENGWLATNSSTPILSADPQPSVLIQLAEAGQQNSVTLRKLNEERPPSIAMLNGIPPVQYRNDRQPWRDYLATHDSRPTPAAEFLTPYARLIGDFLARIDQKQVLASQQQAYADLFPKSPNLTLEQHNALITAFADAEFQFLKGRNEDLTAALLAGDFGNSMRTRIETEITADNRRQTIQIVGSILSVATAGAGMAMASAAHGVAAINAVNNQTRTAVLGIMQSSQQAQIDVFRALSDATVKLTSMQRKVVVQTLTGSIVVFADSVSDLRDDLAVIYAKEAEKSGRGHS